MMKLYDVVPWTAIADAPSGKIPECIPFGYRLQKYPATGEPTHYRFVAPELDREVEDGPGSEPYIP